MRQLAGALAGLQAMLTGQVLSPDDQGYHAAVPYVQLQQVLDQASTWGLRCYEKGLYLDELSDEAIAVITEQVPGKSSPLSYAVIVPMDGAYRDMSDEDTAWGGHRSGYMVFMVALARTQSC